MKFRTTVIAVLVTVLEKCAMAAIEVFMSKNKELAKYIWINYLV